MTPMLDIVFIMLIFFIVTTTFSNELGLSGERPPQTVIESSKTNALSISISETGAIKMLGREVDVRRIVANAQVYLAKNNKPSAAIMAHKNTEHGIVIAVMDQIKQAGISHVQVLVNKD